MKSSIRKSWRPREGRRTCGKAEICKSKSHDLVVLQTQFLYLLRYYPNPPKLTKDVTVEDISGRERDFTLEKNGFILAKQYTKVMLATEDLSNTDKIVEQYYPEMEQWLKDV
jgi:hypothetical protein